MRFEADMLSERFPFISTFKLSILEEPDIDISVRLGSLPDFLILPFVTDHYMKVIRFFLYQQFGAPNYLELDLTAFLADGGDGERLVEDVQAVIPNIIRHKSVAPAEFKKDKDKEKDPKEASVLRRAVRKIGTPLLKPRKVFTPKATPIQLVEQFNIPAEMNSPRSVPCKELQTHCEVPAPGKQLSWSGEIHEPIPFDKSKATTTPRSKLSVIHNARRRDRSPLGASRSCDTKTLVNIVEEEEAKSPLCHSSFQDMSPKRRRSSSAKKEIPRLNLENLSD